jgi:glutamyl-tRNA reductase
MALIDHFKVVTVTHHDVDISDIGNFYVQVPEGESKRKQLERLKQEFKIDELIYLETCNRVTYIMYTAADFCDFSLSKFFEQLNPGLETTTLEMIHSFANLYVGESAIKHLFKMASSMDSLVIGEREIFRQFRKAYQESKDAGLSSDNLRLLEKAIVATAKRIYSNTRIAQKALSVVSLAIDAMIKRNDRREQKILLVGSGETNTLVAKFLRKYDMKNVSIYNRSLDNAYTLASMLGADAYHLRELEKAEDFDTIIICTAANRAVIDNQLFQKMLGNDKSQKLIIDLAVPRNVSEDVVENHNVEYIDISRLKRISEENLAFRKSELKKAEPIIKEQLIAFKSMFHQRQLEKSLSYIPKEIKAIKQRALDEVFGERIHGMDASAKSLLFEMMDYMEKKCISVPLKAAREYNR